MAPVFPEVQGGGSLIIAWQIRGKKVVVVGGGEAGSILHPTRMFMHRFVANHWCE
jgi:precorrin-2 dehydrogenase / sirohydrochlorin ferrochelatase